MKQIKLGQILNAIHMFSFSVAQGIQNHNTIIASIRYFDLYYSLVCDRVNNEFWGICWIYIKERLV